MTTTANNNPAAIGDLITDLFESLKTRAKGIPDADARTVPTGFIGPDIIMDGGLRPGTLTILAARPGTGHDSLALQLAAHAAKAGAFALFFSYDMAPETAAQRLLAVEAGLSSWRVSTGKLTDTDWQALKDAAAALADTKLFIDDGPATYRSMDRRIDELIGIPKPDCGIIFVDDVHHAALKLASGCSRSQAREDVCFEMKRLAERLRMPVVLLADIVRPSGSSWFRAIEFEDLRTVGEVDPYADTILFLDRPFTEVEADVDGRPALDEANLILAKNRYGCTGSFLLSYDESTGRFDDLPADNIF